MKVLVTGGGGFLGQAVVRQLLERGDEVSIFSRSAYPELEALGVISHRGNLAHAEDVSRAVAGVDAVIHVAAKAGPGLYLPDFQAANVEGTRNVIAACRQHGVCWLVHTSSPSVVHRGEDIEGGDESLPLAEDSPAPYPATKAAAEKLALAASDGQLKVCALRPHLIWGPGDNNLLPRLIERNRAGRLKLPAPEKRIDGVYVDNAARAHLLALDNLRSSGSAAGKAYFITNDEPVTVQAWLEQMLTAVGETPRLGRVSPGLAMTVATVLDFFWRLLRLRKDPPLSRFLVEHLATSHWFDISAARRDLGYAPQVSTAEGLRRLAAAHRQASSG